jgi:hypothetical protein
LGQLVFGNSLTGVQKTGDFLGAKNRLGDEILRSSLHFAMGQLGLFFDTAPQINCGPNAKIGGRFEFQSFEITPFVQLGNRGHQFRWFDIAHIGYAPQI